MVDARSGSGSTEFASATCELRSGVASVGASQHPDIEIARSQNPVRNLVSCRVRCIVRSAL